MFGEVHHTCKHGLDVVKLSSLHGDHSCEIFLHGATIASWKRGGEEKIFLSSSAVFDGKKALRGGVPLVFPQFGRPDTSMAQHGFVRTARWTYLGAIPADDTLTAFFRLTHEDVSSSSWPYAFCLVYEVTLTADSLFFTLRIFNTWATSFSSSSSADGKSTELLQEMPYQALLHTYFSLPGGIEEIAVRGLREWSYNDKVDGGQGKTETSDAIIIDREVDRVYYNEDKEYGPTVVTLQNTSSNKAFLTSESYATATSFSVDFASRHLTSSSSSSSSSSSPVDLVAYENGMKRLHEHAAMMSTDVVVWNGWEEKCRAMDDMDDDAYQRYICIEPGLVAKPSRLAPQECLSLTQKLH